MAELMNYWEEFSDLMSRKAENVAPVKISRTTVVKFKYPPFGLLSIKEGNITNLMVFPDDNSVLPAGDMNCGCHTERGD